MKRRPAMTPTTQADDWRALTEAGAELLRQGQPREALQRLQRAERMAPRERDVRYWLANACRATGQVDRARRTLRDLLDERPGDLDASFALAFLLRDAGAPGDAAEVLSQASRQAGVTAHQLLQIAGFLRDGNQFSAAIEVCEKAAGLQPDQADLQFKLARLYLATGAFERSLDALRRTLELQPSTGPAWVALAQQRTFTS
ncbi:MAG: tetratricopeptide repeat protein, partial [Lysobacterales bacterium]